MENPMQHTQSKLFINNMMESAIRIGLLFMLLVWTFDIIKPFVIPVLWGAIIAVALMPMTQKLERALKGRRGLAATILALAGIILLIAPFWIVSSSIFEGVTHIVAVMQAGDIKIPGPTQRVADIPLIGDKLFDAWALFATNLEKAVLHFLPQIKTGVSAAAGMLGSSLGSLVMFIISLAIAGGFMAHAEKSAAAVSTIAVRVVGKNGEEWTSLTAATIRSVLLGVVGVAFIQSLLIGSALFTFSIPAAGIFTFIVFILGIAQLPPLLVVLPIIFYVFSTQDTTPATIFTVWVLIAGISDSFLKPMLMGRGVDVPMPVILIGAIGGMIAAGIIGLFLGAVILAIWYELFTTWLNIEEAQSASAKEADAAEDKLVSAPE
ncbi:MULTISPECIES: AI-2E family transporter [unclassified Shewanella]|uniref:AI-2E family transporter n=1 Tax=unclassified Shewanella TaxID=196818 RepID=UPI001BBF22F5|nr:MULTISPECIES: AI-2E family transporter [unclassified Shewanella]GIU07756.1 AI-2E family transporter [Shewanella sp. MBTL60-112-B1]GIU30388.1 AI-2E family transporter [Shewanella sp. MBTL60-112-B2]